MYSRSLNLTKLLGKKSFFLFGARATGKTTLVQAQLPQAQVFDLLRSDVFNALVRNPSLIEEWIIDPQQYVVIDEIQRLPELLNEIQRLIQRKNIRFLLTGSSARKLRHGGANLLAGRAWQAQLFPLTSHEISDFDLLRYLQRGGLPDIYQSADFEEELESYVALYLQEEIKAEAVTRNVTAFAEFLDLMALSNGAEINYQGFAADLQISPGTLKNYMQILEDTLIGFPLPAYTKTAQRKAISRSKYYLFDIGVTNFLTKTGRIQYKSKAFGDAFEHFIILEVRAYLSYLRKKLPMYYWRSTSQFEVDLICGDLLAIEIKSTELVQDKHLKGLRALKEEKLIQQYLVVSLDKSERRTHDGLRILPWQQFLSELWAGKLF